MSVEQNKTILRRINDEVWSKGQTSLLSQFMISDVCDHTPMPGQPRGLEGERWLVETLRRAIPDMRVTSNLQVGEGDYAAEYWTCTGTQTGELMGMPATHKKYTMTGATLSRFSGDKIAEVWVVAGMLGMLQQLGHAPVPKGIPQEAGRPAATRTGGDSGRGTITPDQKRELIRRAYQEFIDRRNLSTLNEFITPDYVGHFSSYPTIYGQEEFRKYVGMYNQGIPDNRAKVERVLVDGDYAAALVRFTGRQTGRLGDLDPTNKQVDVPSIDLFHFVGDRVNEQWAVTDDLGMMQQLGVIPVGAQARPEPC